MDKNRKKRTVPGRRPVIGERFGKRTVIALAPIRYGHKIFVLCRCDCGREGEVGYDFLIAGRSTVCPFCRPKRFRHGQYDTPEYQVWADMKGRCTNTSHRQYHHYGGRGITYDPSWEHFENFIQDMGPRPSPKHTLDRTDNNGSYSAANCRWVPMIVQQNNKRDNHYLTHNGKTMTVSEWAREVGIHKHTIRQRLSKGWTVANALTLRPDKRRRLKDNPHLLTSDPS